MNYNFYAVARGRNIGIYDYWDDAREQTDGYSHALLKGFYKRCEAKAWLKSTPLVAFCCGSALDNGSDYGHSAYACIFPRDGDYYHESDDLDGPAKSNRAVYCAALAAVQRANDIDPAHFRSLTIYTNNQQLIDAMTERIYTWRENGWVTARNEAVKNRDVIEDIDDEQGPRRITWCYAERGTQNNDWASHWIDQAYASARQAAYISYYDSW